MKSLHWAVENAARAETRCSLYAPILMEIDQEGFAPDNGAMRHLIRAVYKRPSILEHRLARHSHTEAIGSASLRKIGEKFDSDRKLQGSLFSHAKDEARHSAMFMALSKRTNELPEQPHDFGYINEFNDPQIDTFDGNIAAFICDTHVAEIRSLALIGCYLDAAADDDTRFGKSMRSCFESIHQDELRHIGWTGEYVMTWLNSGALPGETLKRSLRYYDSMTWLDISASAEMLAT